MNIDFSKNDNLTAVLTLTLTPEDYKETYEQAIKKEAKNAQMPGFRKGMVPAGHVKRMYGRQILADTVNNEINTQLGKYLQDNHIETLGQPLPVDDDAQYAWDGNDTFQFNFELGLKPEVTVNTDIKDVHTYKVVADEATLAEREMNLRKSYGKMVNPDEVEDHDIISANFTLKKDAQETTSGRIKLDNIANDEVKAKLIGLKKGDTIDINLAEGYDDKAEYNKAVGITDEAEQTDEVISLTVKSIFRLGAADLDEEFYTKAFGEGKVGNEEEFHNAVKKELEDMFNREGENMTANEIYKQLEANNKFELPDEFLKRWLKTNNEKLSDEELEKGYPEFADSLRWNIIVDHLSKDNDLNVTNQEVYEAAKERIDGQVRLYNPTPISEEQLNDITVRFLQEQQNAQQIFDQLRSMKVLDVIKEKVKPAVKEITYQEFKSLAENAQKQG